MKPKKKAKCRRRVRLGQRLAWGCIFLLWAWDVALPEVTWFLAFQHPSFTFASISRRRGG